MARVAGTDPVFQHARREAIIIMLAWLASTVYSCVYSYVYGYGNPGRPPRPEDVHPVWGVPSWVFWGVIVPWGVCAAFTVWFAGWFMADDDLGSDQAPELDREIRDQGLDLDREDLA